MAIKLDHTLVPSHHKLASAKLLAELLGVPWAPSGGGPFSPVYVNEGLTLDFVETSDPFRIYHFCFRVGQQDFDAILARIEAAGIAYRSSVRGPVDGRVDTDHGGQLVYWNEPDGHQWEMLTVSYARQPAQLPSDTATPGPGAAPGHVPPTALPRSPLPGLRTVELLPEHEPLLQRFFEANPAYFLAVHGEAAGPQEAHEEIHGQLPAGWSFTKKWLLGYLDAHGALVAMANVITDLLAPRVWHIGLFLLAGSRHGSGEAQALYRGLETWAAATGAHWLRLGVVQGNTRAERFWQSLGFVQARTRNGVEMGRLSNTLRVMFKPLAGGTLAEYLALIERDRPE